MLALAHLTTGALLGSRARRPSSAFALGVVSHLALDSLPHWGLVGDRRSTESLRRAFLRVALVDGCATLTAAVLVLARSGMDRQVVSGLVGALALDLNKPADLLGLPLWPKWVNAVHRQVQRYEGPHRWPVDILTAAFTGSLYWYIQSAKKEDKGVGIPLEVRREGL